ncbi:MAG TPA: energy transducer TonB [Nitrospinota bacterium]|nr:energy transducer TonB [Nitrospinota bacterium]
MSRTAPVYPAEARERGVEGTVLLRLKILSDGRVGKVEVTRSSGSALLDRAASRSASSWRFAFDGDPPPLGAWAKIPVRFKIVGR